MKDHVEKRLSLLQIFVAGLVLVAAVMLPTFVHAETMHNQIAATVAQMLPTVLYAVSFLMLGLGLFRRTVALMFNGILFSGELILAICSIALVCFRAYAPACLALLAYQVAVFVVSKILYSKQDNGDEVFFDNPDGIMPMNEFACVPALLVRNSVLRRFYKTYIPILLILAVALVLIPASLLGGGKPVFQLWLFRTIMAMLALDPAFAMLALLVCQRQCKKGDGKFVKRRMIAIAVFCGAVKISGAVLCAMGVCGVWMALLANALCLFASILIAMFGPLKNREAL